jgi:hypothetical protein
MKLNAVLVPIVEESDAMFNIFGSTSLPEKEVVRLRFSVVAGGTEEALSRGDGQGVHVE